ncbi:protein translocase subunit secA [Desulfobotulus alkaliphilus]|uniref:Protein translocase subunit SecA n=1 Tax=Desulfobotulus alkaliphilus TaxID=622671 RepID=A0A562RKH2_9BACT|nr:preprotein translocase subunit SecA [Desulfobotulus alkaliphilus]TWI68926.1 protein translocase subunit secA [Desulfobotulus alkaliphilus]
MIARILTRIFGSMNQRELRRIQGYVDAVNALEPEMESLDDSVLAAKTDVYRERFAAGESLESLLPEAFATVREASRRVLEMRHFDCQLIGAVALHEGSIAEMKTGEGKTLMSTLAAYLNAITGKGVHIVTVNDYLARRDAEWMGKLYAFLGLSVGIVVHGMDDAQRREAYAADITYGTNNEFGFDYLRDNMKFHREMLAQRELNFAIVDEVDSILIDEARTPLIISGPAEKSTDLYYSVNMIMPALKVERDYLVDEKARSVNLTEEGVARVEELLKTPNIYEPANIEVLHHVNQALKAYALFKRDADYIVQEGKVIIVDEFTGRLMPGRRYSEGLHQALEAKEGVPIENENQTLASITFQNYFRMYNKLAGMTGTAETEAAEFSKIYGLGVLSVPTHKPMIRMDHADMIYKTKKEKFQAIVEEIDTLHKKGQPVLVGTINIDISEYLSRLLTKKGIPHEVLNAKQHQKEAEIVAQAGQKGRVTIATNMAGRGTDIVLGEGVRELGGLHILGTERHESRRIDNQLRGRSGRQGDPGSSRFYLSLEDDLLRIFGGERIGKIMDRLGLEEGEPIEHRLISRAIENSQKKVEGHNFDIRKHILEYDDVMNQQREVIYRQRREALTSGSLKDFISEMIEEVAEDTAYSFRYDPVHAPLVWEDVVEAVGRRFFFTIEKPEEFEETEHIPQEKLAEIIKDAAFRFYEAKEALVGAEEMRQLERFIVLQTVDSQWKNHLLSMDHLKDGIGLRGYAQQNPLIMYKKEGFAMFQDMIQRIKNEVTGILFRVQIRRETELEPLPEPKQEKLVFSHGKDDDSKEPLRRKEAKVGRNDLCPCGSGKKYKKCCG